MPDSEPGQEPEPDGRLDALTTPPTRLGRPFATFLREHYPNRHVLVLIPEVEPERLWERILRNNRGNVLDHAVRRNTDAVVCRMRFPVPADGELASDPGTSAGAPTTPTQRTSNPR